MLGCEANVVNLGTCFPPGAGPACQVRPSSQGVARGTSNWCYYDVLLFVMRELLVVMT